MMEEKNIVESIPFPNKKYKIIYVDPPWEYEDKALSGDRGACCKYDLMSDLEIKNLPVNLLSDDDCILFMWATYPKLREAFDVIDSWGFIYKTVAFTWVKKFSTGKWFRGMGRWTRSNGEICLLATKGKPKRINAGINQIVSTIPEEHSKKPHEVWYRIIELCGDISRIELFARVKYKGWDVWGNDPNIREEINGLEAFGV